MVILIHLSQVRLVRTRFPVVLLRPPKCAEVSKVESQQRYCRRSDMAGVIQARTNDTPAKMPDAYR